MKKDFIIDILLVIVLIICIISCIVVDREKKNTEIEKMNKKDNLIVSDNIKDTNNYNDKTVESEEDLVEYIEDVELEVNNIVEKEEMSKSEENVLRNTFITLTDFIFYDGEIKGKKFSDVTDGCKSRIIDLYTKIDEKIESKYPNYKENIKDTSKKVYTGVVEKAKQVKENIKNKYKDYVGEEGYNNTVDHYEDGKQDMKDVYEVYKPYIDSGKEKAKSGTKKAKEKVSEWYKNYKESSD